MFNLDAAISKWRREMLDAGIKTPVPLEELESHLREDIEQQMRSGSSAQQAFAAAVQKIGQARTLKNEFTKVHGNTGERDRKFIRIYFVVFPILYLAMCLYGLLNIEMSAAQQLSGSIAIALTALFIWTAPHFHKHLPVIRSKQARLAIQITSLLSWIIAAAVFMNFILPRLHLTGGQLTVSMLWLMTPVAVISSLGYGLGDAARKQIAISDS